MDTQGPVERIVTWWLPQVRAILGQDLCSVLLTGSAALGDYQPGWSDIDVCVVLRRPPTEEEGRSLGLLHDHMKERYVVQRKDGWQSGQVIEGYYIPEALVADPQVELPCYVAGGTTRRWASCHPITPFDRLLLVEAARPLFGTALAFARPTGTALEAQARKDLATVPQWERHSAVWLAGMLHWLARSLVFWRDGRLLAKSEALRHEIGQGSPYAEAFRRALHAREEGSVTAANHLETFRGIFGRQGLAAADDVDRAIAARRASRS